MDIYEKIFRRLDELNMSQKELSRRTGIATSTISDWKKKKINPQSDKSLKNDGCQNNETHKVNIIQDDEGKNVVLINDKRFKGLSKDDWKEVEDYLKNYIGEFYEIAYCSEKIFI